MKRGLLSLLVLGIVFWANLPASAAADSHPALHLRKIPWQLGQKVEGVVEVVFAASMTQPAIYARSSATRTDDRDTGHWIPPQGITFTRWQPGGDREAAQPVPPGTKVAYLVSVENIPAAGVYEVPLVATDANGVQDPALPPLKITALPDVQVTFPSGSDRLVTQWTNLETPSWLWEPLRNLIHRFLPLEQDSFIWLHNQPVQLELSMPGGQEASVMIQIDPAVNEEGDEATELRFWAFPRQVEPEMSTQTPPSPSGQTLSASPQPPRSFTRYDTLTVNLTENQSYFVEVLRQHSHHQGGAVHPGSGISSNVRLTAERIQPGIYKTRARVISPWGTVQEFPIEIHVRDGILWPAVAVVVGILLSFLANLWLSHKDLLRAYSLTRRWWSLYQILQEPGKGRPVEATKQVLQRSRLAIIAGDSPAALQAATLLVDLVRNSDMTQALDQNLEALLQLNKADAVSVWAAVTGAEDLKGALQRLADYCASVEDAAVQEMAKRFVPLTAPKVEPKDARKLTLPLLWRDIKNGLKRYWRGLLSFVYSPVTPLPGIWVRSVGTTSIAYVVLFFFVGASVVLLQLTQAYYPNTAFGSPSDYLNLLFWGFAGDTTRTKVIDLARGIMPGMPTKQPNVAPPQTPLSQ